MSPSRRYDLHAEQRPSRHPCIRWTPCRKAASRMFSSSATSISMSTGSKLMRCLSSTGFSFAADEFVGIPVDGAGKFDTVPPTGVWDLRQGVGPIGRNVCVPFLVAHLVEQH